MSIKFVKDIDVDGSGTFEGDVTVTGEIYGRTSAAFPGLGGLGFYSLVPYLQNANQGGLKIQVQQGNSLVDALTLDFSKNATFAGNVTADSFIKDSATSDDVLLGDGTTTSLSGISDGHAHTNKVTLDKFGEDVNGKPTYNGNVVDTTIAQRDVYDGLDSTDNTISLSASQGKALKDAQDLKVDGSGTANYVSKWNDSNTLEDSVIYDDGTDVGIGTTSPISKFTVTGTDNTNQANIGHSTQSVFIKVNGTNVDYNSSGNSGGSHTFSTGNTERLRITEGGNVGIGTDSPSNKLVVCESNTTGLEIAPNHSNAQVVVLAYDRTAGAYREINFNASNYVFRTSATERMRIDSDGNVGIGTDSPDKKMTIVDTDAGSTKSVLRLENNGTTVGTGVGLILSTKTSAGGRASSTIRSESEDTSGNNSLVFATPSGGSSSEAMRIDSDGNVGIGTDSPDAKLEVSGGNILVKSSNNGGGATNNNLILFDTDTTASGGQGIGSVQFYGSDASGAGAGVKSEVKVFYANDGDSSIMTFSTSDSATNNQERMRIDSSGRVTIGTTNAATGAVKLVIADDSGAGLEFIPQTSSDRITLLGYDRTASTYQNIDLDGSELHFNISGTEKMRIDSSGNVGIGTDDPARKVQIDGGSSDGAIQFTNTVTGSTASDGTYVGHAGTGTDFQIWNYETGYIRFGTNDVERLTIDSSGNSTFAGNVTAGSNALQNGANPGLKVTSTNTHQTVLSINNTTTRNYELAVGGTSNLIGSGSFYIYDGEADVARLVIDSSGNSTFAGDVTADSFIKDGGTSSEYLMADGSVSSGPSGSGTVSGTGTVNKLSKFSTGGSDIEDSSITDDGTTVTLSGGIMKLNKATGSEIESVGALSVFSTTDGSSDITIGDDSNEWKAVNMAAAAFGWRNNGSAVMGIGTDGNVDITNDLTANSFIKDGGTSSQFLKADGSVDTSTYVTGTIPTTTSELTNDSGFLDSLTGAVLTTGTQTVGGAKTFSDTVKFSGTFGNLDTTSDLGMQFELGTSALNTLRTDADAFRIYFGGTSGIGQAYKITQEGQHDWDGASGGNKMRLTTAGDLHVDGDVIAYSTTVSDVSMKDNIKTIENVEKTVKGLRGVSYDWNKGSRKGKSEIGLIAQEVEQVLPNLVHEKEMMNGDTIKTVDYQKMIGLLIESNKELYARIEKLECGCSTCDCKK